MRRRDFLAMAGAATAGLVGLVLPGRASASRPPKKTTTTAAATTTTLATTTTTTEPMPTTTITLGAFVYDVLILASDSNATAQAKIDAAASTAIVGFDQGVHAERKVTPKLGQTLRGHPNGLTVFDGSRLVTGWTGTGPWVASHSITNRGVTIDLTGQRTATGDDVGSQYPEELFYVTPNQGTGWTRKNRQGQPTTAAPSAGKWTMDYASGTLRVADDPTTTSVRISATDTAIVAPALAAGGLTIEDITFQKYATDIWHSAAGHGADHRDWTYRRVAMLDNHGTGFYLGPGDTVTGSRSCYQGFEGFSSEGEAGGYVAGFTILDTEVAYNKVARYDWGWEGGGSKFDTPTSGTGLVIRNCWWHHNYGPAIWTDLNATETSANTIESCLIEDNYQYGVDIEITAGTTLIRWNRLLRNCAGSVPNTGGPVVQDWSPAIEVGSSRGVTIQSNVIDGGPAGIAAVEDGRSPNLNACSVQDNSIRITSIGGLHHSVRFQSASGTHTEVATCGADSNRYWSPQAFGYDTSTQQTFAQWQAVRTGAGLTGALDPNGTAGLTGSVTDPSTFVPFTLSHYGPGV